MSLKFSGLQQQMIILSSEKGPYAFVCTRAAHGTGRRFHDLAMEGISRRGDMRHPNTVYNFEFEGSNIPVTIEDTGYLSGEAVKIRVSCLVPDPDFWA
jgi:hypothetical protein